MNYTKDQVRDFMKRIPGELAGLEYEEVINQCNRHFPLLPGKTVPFNNAPFFFRSQQEYGGLNVVYRARPDELPGNRPWDHVSEISFVQEKDLKKINEFGRLNKPEEAVFYGALNRETACAEAITKGEEFNRGKSAVVTLGIWKFESPLTLFKMTRSVKYFSQLYKLVGLEPNSNQLEQINKVNAEFKSRLSDPFEYEKFEFYSNEFAKFGIGSHKDYMLSTYFSHRIFNRLKDFKESHPVDGIEYPSIAYSYQYMNLALKPEVIIERKLRLIMAEQVWVRNLMSLGKGAEFRTLKRSKSILPDGTIDWPK